MRIVTAIFRGFLALGLLATATAFARQDSAPGDPPATIPSSRPGTQPAGAKAKPERAFLRVNRNLEIKGYIELEDDNVIVVRDLQGNSHSFAKARVAQIVRLVEPQPDQSGVVVMLDGQIREGKIIEDAFDHVIIEIEGIRANLKRETVSYVLLEPTIDERYHEYKKALQPGNYDAHLTLCKWLFEQRRYQQCKEEILALLEQVDMPQARQLLNLVEAQLALQSAPAPRPDAANSQPENTASTGDDGSNSGPVRPADLLPQQLLTDQDVNLIRVYEIDFEHPPRVTITPATVRELIEKYSTSTLIPASQTGRNAMFRTAADNPLQLVRLMFELRARDMYSAVQVNSEPYALNLFRRRVHDTWLINNCATTACHGSPYSGRFFLHRRDYKDDRVRYTNLLILERLKLDPEWPLINYERPEDSLIIQYGLARDMARKPHPRVDGWKPAFNPINPRLKEEAVEWIQAMMQPRPDYPVDYEPPIVGILPHQTPTPTGDGSGTRIPR